VGDSFVLYAPQPVSEVLFAPAGLGLAAGEYGRDSRRRAISRGIAGAVFSASDAKKS
jgi:hypothetical protein